jgi:hypothetical protein
LACLRDISRPSWLAEFYRGGRLLKIRKEPRDRGKAHVTCEWQLKAGCESPGEPTQVGHGANMGVQYENMEFKPRPRGMVAGFTRASRMRLLCKMNTVAAQEAPARPKFITLTYPREILPSWKWAKYQLDQFLHRLFRKFGKLAVLWRMEHQEDGSIHYHMVVWYTPYIPWWWIANAWDTLIGNQVAPSESASTEIRALRSWRQTSYYVSKYIAKDTDLSNMDIFHGRHWGCRNWRLLPVHRVLMALTESEGYAMRRWVRRLRIARGVATRHLGKPLPFCHQSEAGITMFLPEHDVRRMLFLCRGYDGLKVLPSPTCNLTAAGVT